MAGEEAAGSTAYVTLEPCSHHGKTPPCCDRLIQEKVSRVVIACADPNPAVAGRGIERLRQNGIQVDVGLLGQESMQMNEMFNKFIVTRLPFVTLKSATTLDGKIAAKTGDSKWITGDKSRAYVHTLRHRHQSIMVGIGTVLADNPQLTARLTVPAVQPTRIVVDSKLRIPMESKLLTDGEASTIVLTTGRASADRIKRIEDTGAAVLVCGDQEAVDLPLAMRRLGELDIGSILLEGGGALNGSMLEKQLVDKVMLFFAPKLIGGYHSPGAFQFAGFDRMSEAVELEQVEIERFEPDICITGYPIYRK
jgi:diaminohydroxyphosphoribosylaminopyrimidine deaminase/5-amino-6-(5-phosphoribosylamino)uracil reductase